MGDFTSASLIYTDNKNYSAIASAIRKAAGTKKKYYPYEMAPAIRSINNFYTITNGGDPATFSRLQDVLDFYSGPYQAAFGVDGDIMMGDFGVGNTGSAVMKEWYRYGDSSTGAINMATNTVGYPVTVVASAGASTLLSRNAVTTNIKFLMTSGYSSIAGRTTGTDANGNTTYPDLSKYAITELSLPGMQVIGAYAFRGAKTLTYINAPDLTLLMTDAFYNTGISEAGVSFPVLASVSGAHQFAGTQFVHITSDIFPELTTVTSGTFRMCTKLQDVYLPKLQAISRNLFSGCTSLKSVVFPEVTSVENTNAFNSCPIEYIRIDKLVKPVTNTPVVPVITNLKEAYLPSIDNVTASMFQNAKQLTSLFAPNITGIWTQAFESAGLSQITYNDYPLVSLVGTSACKNMSNLETVLLDAVTVSADAFRNCPKLTVVGLPSVTTIASNAFVSSPAIQNVNLDSLSNLATELLSGKKELEVVYLANCGVINTNAFNSCTSLIYVDMPNVSWVGAGAFRSTGMSQVIANSLMKTSGSSAFAQMPNLTDVQLGSGIALGNYTFDGDTNLQWVTNPVGTIGTGAFRSCYSLQYIEIEGNIGDYAFQYCSSLSLIKIVNSTAMVTCGASTSNGMAASTMIAIPRNLSASYLANTNWKRLSSRFTYYDP